MVKRQKRCSSEQLDDTTVPLSDSVKSLGVLLDCTLALENFISQTAKSCYYQFRRISSVRNYLSAEARSPPSFCHASTTAVFSVLARLLPLYIAFLAFGTVLLATYYNQTNNNNNVKSDHITPLFHSLHRLRTPHPGEENSPDAPAGTRTQDFSIANPALYH